MVVAATWLIHPWLWPPCSSSAPKITSTIVSWFEVFNRYGNLWVQYGRGRKHSINHSKGVAAVFHLDVKSTSPTGALESWNPSKNRSISDGVNMQSNGVNMQSNGVIFSGEIWKVFNPISLRPSESQTTCLDHACEQAVCIDPLQTSKGTQIMSWKSVISIFTCSHRFRFKIL